MELELELKERIMAYWDIRAMGYDQMRHSHLYGQEFQFWKDEITAKLPGQGLHVLDVGTATGFLAIVCASLGHRVTAIDLSRHMLQRARNNAAEFDLSVSFLQMDAHQLEFPSDYFDAVITRNTIWTTIDPRQVYEEMFRVCKPGGIFLNYDANYGKTKYQVPENMEDLRVIYAECEAYKSLLPVSYVQRPEWDMATLRDLGFVHCECSRNVSGKLGPHGKRANPGKPPMFSIYAVKPSMPKQMVETDYDFQPFLFHNQLFYREQRQFGNNKDTEHLIMGLIFRQPEGIRPSDISEYLFIPKQTITRILASLADEGYVRHLPNPRDHRSTLIAITQKGIQKYQKEEQQRRISYARVLSRFPLEKLEQLNRLYIEFLDAFPSP